MQMNEVRARINEVPNRHHRNVLSFCTVGEEMWDFEPVITQLRQFTDGSLTYLSSSLKTMGSDWHAIANDEMRLFVRERIMSGDGSAKNAVSSGKANIWRAAEDEDLWCDSLVASINSAHAINIDYPHLFKTEGVEATYLRFVFKLMVGSSPDYSLFDSVDTPLSQDEVVVSQRLVNHDVIEMVSEHPKEWERVAELMLHGAHTRAAITAVLNGEVIPAFADGVL